MNSEGPGTSGGARSTPAAIIAVVAVILGVLAIAAAAALLSGRMVSRRATAEATLQRAIDRVEDADEVVLDIDATIQKRVEADSGADARKLQEAIPVAERRLAEAVRLAGEAREDLSPDRRARAEDVTAAAEARRAMLREADELLATRAIAADALGPARQGWEQTQDAESLLRQAVQRYNLHTDAGVTSSVQLVDRAVAVLASATADLQAAERAMPEADIEPFIAYVRDRTALARVFRGIDEVWLADRVAEANTRLSAYNASERRLVERAKQLRGTPADAVAKAYDELTAPAAKRYFDARERARKADDRVRAERR